MQRKPLCFAGAMLFMAGWLAGGCTELAGEKGAAGVSGSAAQIAPPPESGAPVEPAKRAGKEKKSHYLSPEEIDVRALLSGPPAGEGTALSRAEIQLVLAIEADAPAGVKARAEQEGVLEPWVFADVLGPGFSKEKMPRTAALLTRAEEDSNTIYLPVKKMWARQRPYQQDARVSVGASKPANASYPSGHATRGMMWACILGKLAPEKAEALRLRAAQAAEDRVVAGLHFPSDVVAGMALGEAMAEKMASNPAFQRDLEEARGEWPR
jgi:acid phosphatase (class A)